MTLRDALLTLAGPAWELHADDRARQICFERPGDRAVAESPSEPPATEAVQMIVELITSTFEGRREWFD